MSQSVIVFALLALFCAFAVSISPAALKVSAAVEKPMRAPESSKMFKFKARIASKEEEEDEEESTNEHSSADEEDAAVNKDHEDETKDEESSEKTNSDDSCDDEQCEITPNVVYSDGNAGGGLSTGADSETEFADLDSLLSPLEEYINSFQSSDDGSVTNMSSIANSIVKDIISDLKAHQDARVAAQAEHYKHVRELVLKNLPFVVENALQSKMNATAKAAPSHPTAAAPSHPTAAAPSHPVTAANTTSSF